MTMRVRAALGLICALASAATATSAAALPAGGVAGQVPTATRSAPRAGLSGSVTRLGSGKLRVVLRTNAARATLSWRTAANKPRSAVVRISAGSGSYKLPAGSTAIRARARATKALRASTWLRVEVVAANPPATPPAGAGSPAPISGFAVSRANSTSIMLTWVNPPGTARVVVRRAVGLRPPGDPTAGVAVALAGPTDTAVTDAGLASATTYAYAAFALDAAGRPSPRVATATTTDPATGSGGVAVPALVPASAVPTAQPGFTGMPGSLLPVGSAGEAGYYSTPASCDPTEKPGVRRFYEVFHKAYPVGRFGGITRLCALGEEGEHKEGRAVDWMIDSRQPTGRQQGDNIVGWLTADDGRDARSLGIEYIIWRDMMWRAYEDGPAPRYGWSDYASCMSSAKQATAFTTSCHRDHIHLSFSWDGAYARTSFWTGAVLPDNDFGTCRAVAGESAAMPTGVRSNLAECPEPAAKRWWNAGVGGSRLVLGATGATALKALLAAASGVPATPGDTLDAETQSALVKWQSTHGLPTSGAADLSTWASLRTALGQVLPLQPTLDLG